MRRRNSILMSRRAAVIGGALALLGLGRRTAVAQPAATEAAAAEPSLEGRTLLVTGSTDGLGREVAGRLGALGAFVIVHGRNVQRGEAVVREIKAGGRGDAAFYPADFASLAAVRDFAATVLAEHDRLDLLINNAGIWRSGRGDIRRTSEDDYELVFAVNYLSGFLLTHLLLPRLESSAPARIVNVASAAQRAIDFDDVMLERGFSESRAYSQSKLAQIMFTFELARRLPAESVTVNSLHPASLMNTTMVREAGVTPRTTVDQGARALMQLAVAPDLAGRTGLYFDGLDEAQAEAQAYDRDACARLWALSMELTGLA